MILAQWDARGAAHTSPKSRHPHAPRPSAPVAATSPEPPRRVIAKPEVVGTGSRLSGITEGTMRHDPERLGSQLPPRTDGGDGSGGGGVSVNRRSSHLSNWCLQLTLMLLKVKDTSVMLREGGTPGGSNLGSSSVMVAPRPTGPRSLTVMPIGSSQQLPCCETEVILHDPESLKSDPWPTSRDLSIGTLGSVGSPR